MSLRNIIENFARGFPIIGIILKTSDGKTIPMVKDTSPLAILLAKRLLSIPIGLSEQKIPEEMLSNSSLPPKVGIINEVIDENKNILIFVDSRHLAEVNTHWKRFMPIVRKQSFEEFESEDLPAAKLIELLEEIRNQYDQIKSIIEEKLEDVI